MIMNFRKRITCLKRVQQKAKRSNNSLSKNHSRHSSNKARVSKKLMIKH